MTTDTTPRFIRLRQWMDDNSVTYRFVATILGVSESAVPKILKRDTMPTKHHKACVEIGFPVEMLPQGKDLKRGRRTIIPSIPAMRRLIQTSARM